MAHRGGGKRQRRKFRAYLKGKIDITMGLGALGAKAVTTFTNPDVLDETAWITSVRAVYTLSGFTPAAGDGPIYVGVAHSDYAIAEIEAWIENLGSWERGDKISQEIARRKIRQVGILVPPADTAAATSLNDGKPITTKCNWALTTGDTVKVWAYNAGGSPITTGSAVHVLGHANLWPSA